MRLSAVITLCVSTANHSQAALAPKREHGNTPAASSFFSTSWMASMVPAFSRCHSSRRLASDSHTFVTTAKCLASARRRIARLAVCGCESPQNAGARTVCHPRLPASSSTRRRTRSPPRDLRGASVIAALGEPCTHSKACLHPAGENFQTHPHQYALDFNHHSTSLTDGSRIGRAAGLLARSCVFDIMGGGKQERCPHDSCTHPQNPLHGAVGNGSGLRDLATRCGAI